MQAQPPIADLTHLIQLSVAPVFLLTALGTMLGVFSARLGRIVDRARKLRERVEVAGEAERALLGEEVRVLARRRRRVNAAITAATCAALLVCVLIASAFIGSIWHWDVSHWVAGLFVAAMVAFIVALLSFLSEVLIAVASVRLEP